MGIQELGPRFTLKLRSLQKGTFDSKFGEYEWIHKVCLNYACLEKRVILTWNIATNLRLKIRINAALKKYLIEILEGILWEICKVETFCYVASQKWQGLQVTIYQD